MEILGHSQISITMDVYTHVVHDTQREAISHMVRLLKRRLPSAVCLLPSACCLGGDCRQMLPSKAPDHDRSGAFPHVPPAGFEPATPA
ncbi:site-specific integrase [Streptomyces olivochromogenes]|uniref:Site-specific integrase n=1 Tax=Streptomyces olivochromogenes TaxID=1963 RepID=A0A250VGG4_STROL|nr:site-specific integrase [Streptomyces olivochromogenes]